MVLHVPARHRARPPTAARRSVAIAAWTLVSRVTGLARVVVIGAVLGPTFLANVFLASNTVPAVIYSAIAGPVLALVVVPALVEVGERVGANRAEELLGRITGLLLIGSAAVAIGLVLASPALAWALTAGVPDEATRARAWQLTVLMLVFVAPQVVLYTVAALGAAAQQTRGRFALAAAAPALENVGLMITVLVVATVYAPGLEVGQAPLGMIVFLGVGATASVAMHAGVQWVGAARAGLPIRPGWRWRPDPEVATFAGRLRESVATAACPAVAYVVVLVLAGSVAGGVVVLQLAWAVYSLPAALGVRAVATAVLPGLAAAAARADGAEFGRSWRQALTYACYASLPPLLLLVLFADPIAEILANGELRDTALAASLATCVAVLAVAQLAAALHEIGKQALFAKLDMRGPRMAGAASLAAMTAVGMTSLVLPADTTRLTMLAVAVLTADAAAAAAVIHRMRRIIEPERLVDVARIRAAVVAALCMVPAVGAGWALTREATDRVQDLLIMIPVSALGLAIFALTLKALDSRVGGTA